MSQRTPLVVFPYWRSNPYVTLTLLGASTAGFDVVPTTTLNRLLAVLQDLGRGAIFHLHWTSKICQDATTEIEATRHLDDFRTAVRQFRTRGGRVVWTVHNAQPHELKWPELEGSLTQFLADTADRIHVMNPATSEVMSPVVTLRSDRVREVPHPSYVGVYPRARCRTEVRSSLGFDPDVRVVALIGELRSYKGVDILMEAMKRAASISDHPLALLLAGKVADDEIESLQRSIPTEFPVVFRPGYIDSADMAEWFEAADLCVFPYERILNSGSAHLAATMGVPVVLPGVPHLTQIFGDQPWAHFYDRDRTAESLALKLTDPATFERHDASARDFCRELSPWRISLRMLEQIYVPLRRSAAPKSA